MCASMLFLERGCCRCPTRECGKRGQCIFVALLYHLLALYRRAPAFSVRRRRQIITRSLSRERRGEHLRTGREKRRAHNQRKGVFKTEEDDFQLVIGLLTC